RGCDLRADRDALGHHPGAGYPGAGHGGGAARPQPLRPDRRAPRRWRGEARALCSLTAVARPAQLDKEAEPIIEGILMAAPDAVAATKRLLREAHGFEPLAASRDALAAEGARRPPYAPV